MKTPLPQNVQALRTALLENPGRTNPELRQSVEANAAALSGRVGPIDERPPELPPELVNYVEKVARFAYKVTDEDVETLLASGYTEDELFEITLSAALGASLARMERGLLALKGAS